MNEITYNFKCDWDCAKIIDSFDEEHYRLTHMDVACNGNHSITIDEIFYIMLISKLIFHYNLTVDKIFIYNLINDFEIYFQNKIKKFENGEWNTNHFHSIDIYAEIINDYCNLKYEKL